MTNSKLISEKQEQDIISALTEAYGEQDEDWGGCIIKVKGQEKFYAVKCPTSSQWFEFKNKANLYFTKLQAQANNPKAVPVKGLEDVMINLVADCLITDVAGVATSDDYLQDFPVKLNLVDNLVAKITELADSGLRQIKKG